jgi:hypothetical protein
MLGALQHNLAMSPPKQGSLYEAAMSAELSFFLYAPLIVAMSYQSFSLIRLMRESLSEFGTAPPQPNTARGAPAGIVSRLALDADRGMTRALPQFNLPIIGKDQTVSTADFIGRETVVLFLRASTFTQLGRDALLATIRFCWSKTDDTLFVVCSGGDGHRWTEILRELGLLSKAAESEIAFILDVDGGLERALDVQSVPHVIFTNPDGDVKKRGGAIFSEVSSPTEPERARAPNEIN